MDPAEFLHGLAAKCPEYSEALSNCPLNQVRKEADPKAAISQLPDEKVDDLIRAHFLCVCRKNGCGM